MYVNRQLTTPCYKLIHKCHMEKLTAHNKNNNNNILNLCAHTHMKTGSHKLIKNYIIIFHFATVPPFRFQIYMHIHIYKWYILASLSRNSATQLSYTSAQHRRSNNKNNFCIAHYDNIILII